MTGSSMALASHVVLLVISALVAARYVRAGLAYHRASVLRAGGRMAEAENGCA